MFSFDFPSWLWKHQSSTTLHPTFSGGIVLEFHKFVFLQRNCLLNFGCGFKWLRKPDLWTLHKSLFASQFVFDHNVISYFQILSAQLVTIKGRFVWARENHIF